MSNKIVAIIPARAGSKRLDGKNTRSLCGKPLITWSVESALKCHFINEVIVTTNDKKITSLVLDWMLFLTYGHRIRGIIRPEELATENALMIDVILHATEKYDNNTIIILLQPTAPLRTADDILNAFVFFNRNKHKDGLVTGYVKDGELEIKLNGAIYIYYLSVLRAYKRFFVENMLVYLMPKERSVDINTEKDFYLAEKYMKERLNE